MVYLLPVFIMFWAIFVTSTLRKRNIWYTLCYAIFSLYLLFAVDKVFFPIQIDGGYADARRQLPFWSDLNIIPFYFGPYGLEDALSTVLLNVLLTIPFGFGISFIVNIRPRVILWIAPCVGLSFEGTQLLISIFLRYMYRIMDINDVIMNALGVLIGYGAFLVFVWVYVSASQVFKLKHYGLTAYIYEVAHRVKWPQEKRKQGGKFWAK